MEDNPKGPTQGGGQPVCCLHHWHSTDIWNHPRAKTEINIQCFLSLHISCSAFYQADCFLVDPSDIPAKSDSCPQKDKRKKNTKKCEAEAVIQNLVYQELPE